MKATDFNDILHKVKMTKDIFLSTCENSYGVNFKPLKEYSPFARLFTAYDDDDWNIFFVDNTGPMSWKRRYNTNGREYILDALT